MKAYEFNSVSFEGNEADTFSDKLAALGNQGWQLVQISENEDNGIDVLLQRPKTHELFSLLRHMIEYYYENGGINRELMVRLDDMIEE